MTRLNMPLRSTDGVFIWILPKCIYISHRSAGTRSHYSQEAWMKCNSIVISQLRCIQFTIRHDYDKAKHASQVNQWGMEQVLTSVNIFFPLVIRYLGGHSQEAWMKCNSIVVSHLRLVQFTIRDDHGKAQEASQVNIWGIWIDLTSVYIYILTDQQALASL